MFDLISCAPIFSVAAAAYGARLTFNSDLVCFTVILPPRSYRGGDIVLLQGLTVSE